MAKNRVPTKWIRDGIKSHYKKDCKCAICGTDEDLELHHYTTVSLLLKRYATKNKIPINNDDQVKEMRDEFYKAHWYELVDYTVTLCAMHHKQLHKLYGVAPPLVTASKQERWVKLQHDKHHGLAVEQPSIFGRFLT